MSTFVEEIRDVSGPAALVSSPSVYFSLPEETSFFLSWSCHLELSCRRNVEEAAKSSTLIVSGIQIQVLAWRPFRWAA